PTAVLPMPVAALPSPHATASAPGAVLGVAGAGEVSHTTPARATPAASRTGRARAIAAHSGRGIGTDTDMDLFSRTKSSGSARLHGAAPIAAVHEHSYPRAEKSQSPAARAHFRARRRPAGAAPRRARPGARG